MIKKIINFLLGKKKESISNVESVAEDNQVEIDIVEPKVELPKMDAKPKRKPRKKKDDN